MSTEMKLVTACIHPHLEARVVKALHDLPEFPGFSIIELRGQGRGKGADGTYLASETDLVYQRHLQLQIVCATDAVETISRIVAEAGWTGRKGDGVIIVTPVEGFSRIREAGARAAREASR
ncbi:MAG: transcriptional regulator [Rhizobiales bacterium 24-66-13]|uniref:P-II family nitrogen regulator n=1 Tax=Roseixanthobacter finlandensis TaxID=3119922 RepID=UPI000BC6ECA9|nr:MAG: transcriptional regulator [Rhizobiales bacterium 35-66-30]OYZ82497.1 MAG: transcriptional regulator [Rhizobiales bacterium 24-66-13]OZB11265.1 MAG: transcriptional regulator [Rhizobiales bacterium 39-66-18]HQS46498.1 P-II family nitrogen regulator [Xanthobacteraceae bacterium]